MAADKMEEAIKPTSDCELALEPPINAKRCVCIHAFCVTARSKISKCANYPITECGALLVFSQNLKFVSSVAGAHRMFKPLPTEHFTYTKVFPSFTSQEHYFKATMVPLVSSIKCVVRPQQDQVWTEVSVDILGVPEH